jgi:site-specific DNA-cytosine methylase
MENVKGMLSSSVGGTQIFKNVMADLQGAAGPDSYRLVALCRENDLDFGEEPKPAEFLVRAEEHGVPQARHRVIIVGLRSDIARAVPPEFVPRLRRHSRRCRPRDRQPPVRHAPRGSGRAELRAEQSGGWRRSGTRRQPLREKEVVRAVYVRSAQPNDAR